MVVGPLVKILGFFFAPYLLGTYLILLVVRYFL
jgi:hypothetical protein